MKKKDATTQIVAPGQSSSVLGLGAGLEFRSAAYSDLARCTTCGLMGSIWAASTHLTAPDAADEPHLYPLVLWSPALGRWGVRRRGRCGHDGGVAHCYGSGSRRATVCHEKSLRSGHALFSSFTCEYGSRSAVLVRGVFCYVHSRHYSGGHDLRKVCVSAWCVRILLHTGSPGQGGDQGGPGVPWGERGALVGLRCLFYRPRTSSPCRSTASSVRRRGGPREAGVEGEEVGEAPFVAWPGGGRPVEGI